MFEIQLCWTEHKQIMFVEKVEGKDLVEVLSKQLLMVQRLQEAIIVEINKYRGDDDIPF